MRDGPTYARSSRGPSRQPRGFYWGERRIGIVEMIDQWYGPDYRYVKAKADDSGVCILRFAEIRSEWALIMFVSAQGQAPATQAA